MKSILCFLFACICLHTNAQFSLHGDAVSLGGDCYRLTTTITSQEGAIWSDEEVNLNYSFRVDFELYLGNSDAGADGMTFTMQQDNSGVGIGGGSLGYGGISPSICAQFDTWQNLDHSDPTYDHVAIMKDGGLIHGGVAALSGYVQIISGVSNAEDGNYHDYSILWDADTHTFGVYVDCVFRVSYTGDIAEEIFDGDSLVYFGFTGATGGAVNTQNVCFGALTYLTDPEPLADVNICAGDSIQLELEAGYAEYLWLPDIGISDNTIYNPVFFPADSTTYTVVYSDACGEEFTDTVNVFVYPDNSDFYYDASTYCPDGIIYPAFIETPGGLFTIEPATVEIDETTGAIDLTDAEEGTYYIEYTPPLDECPETHGEYIIVEAYPDATIAYADTVFCASGSVLPSVIATTGGTFSIAPAGVTINAVTGSVNLSTATIGTTYTVTYNTSTFCNSTADFSFTIIPFDDASFAYDTTHYCPSGTVLPESIALAGGEFSITPASMDIDAITGEIDLSTGISGTVYTVTYTTATDACGSSATASVIIDPLDDPDFAYDGSLFCASGTIVPIEIATSGGTFASTPSVLEIDDLSGEINLETGAVGTTYTITYTTPDGPCQNDASVSITIDANDDSTFAYVPDTFCPAGTVLPDVIATPGGIFSVTPVGLDWNITTGALDLAAATPGNYTITYTTPAGACSSVSEFDITIDTVTDAYFYFDTDGYCNYGTAIPFILHPGGTFSASTGLSINTVSGEINLDASVAGGPYSVFYNSPGCTEQDTFLITVFPTPVLSINFETPVCIEAPPVLLTGTPAGGIFTGDGVSGNYFDPSAIGSPGIYNLLYTYTDGNGCTNSINSNIQVIEHTVFAGTDITIIEGSTTQLNANGGILFEWDPPDGLSCTGCENPAAQPAQTTTYTVTSYDENGCIAFDDVIVEVVPFDDITVFVPNAFTPNGDGLNDFLFAFGSDIEEILAFRVFDRWGAMIWEGTAIPADAVNMGWDGTINGKPAQAGVYAYTVEVKLTFGTNKSTFGNTTLLR